ncbi:hypothetical protein FK220_018330 [Flavobacteriaceae bacterium TP-CH-4]|uniref:Uncharacterized protein n=1 Tax=Pelagihabitans pacificus TaxID=2696054 RepID=A0A967B1D4_9FLAO|nr:hypothetical protein [Pelagihabitans pacificus]NHF61317.1 hypothetical protein [Pelagihabitans pacificus]
MLLNDSAQRPQMLYRSIKLLNIAYSIICSFNLVMLLLYHTTVKQELKLAAAYAFFYTILGLFLPALFASVGLTFLNRRKKIVDKALIENHLKFVMMAVVTFVVLNAHHFVLSLLR